MATKAETVKEESRFLRGSLPDELTGDGTAFTAEAGSLLKFHGIYQQDDRDQRRQRTRAGEAPAYSCMVRCSVPGGILTADQWLAIDGLADRVADGTLRLTTRQGVQYHFVHKGNLRSLIGELNRSLVTTYAACGDVVRNIMVSSTPTPDHDLDRLNGMATALANHFQPRSGAYWELWVDGERAVSAGPPSEPEAEPIYGRTYLPRKFKIGVAWPGDNSIDVYSQDVGLVLAPGPDGQPGAVVLAGGGLGRSHTDATTFPRLAEPLAWVPDDSITDVVEAIVATFRDHGNREDRSHARLKYLVEQRGIGWLRRQVEDRTGQPLSAPVPLPPWDGSHRRYLGWHRQDDHRWFLGLPVPSGRLADLEHLARRTAVREVVNATGAEIRLTPHQNLLVCGLTDDDRAVVERVLADHNVPAAAELSLSVLSSMACPALPTCGQALGEAERVLPDLTDLLDRLLTQRGLGDVAIETRMTGCPNGCARPYVAELGIVGRTKTAYDVFVGGDPAGTRLAELLIESVPFTKLSDIIDPLLERYQDGRLHGEAFGGWANRVGTSALAEGLPSFARSARAGTGAER